MVHEQSATIMANILHFIIVVSVVIFLLGISLGKIEVNNVTRNLESFEIGRTYDIPNINPPPKTLSPKPPKVKRYKPCTVKIQPTIHPIFNDCVDGLSAVGIGRGEAKRAVKAFLRDMPHISNVEQFLQEYFSRRA